MARRRVDLTEAVRRACLALPDATERTSHGTPCFFCPKQFVMLWPDGHHGAEFAQMWFAAEAGAQAELVESEPDRFFVPPYVGTRGWVGLRLDADVDAGELVEICRQAHAVVHRPPRRPGRASGATT